MNRRELIKHFAELIAAEAHFYELEKENAPEVNSKGA